MPKFGFTDNDGIDVGNKYVTKEYLLDRYQNIAIHSTMPSLWGWGDNGNGQLGDNTTTAKSSPVTTAGAGINWRNISGAGHIIGVKTDGTLWTWGAGTYGVLGNSATTARSSPGTTAANVTTWAKVSAGDRFSAAIRTDGTLWTWGRNNQGQLGTTTTTNRSSPGTAAGAITTWAQVACGYEHILGIAASGVLYSWGRGTSGGLGSSATTARSSPVSIAGTNWATISAGFNCSAATKSDGTLWTWGSNNVGQLGDGTTTNRSSPITTAAGGTNWKQVSIGRITVAAVKTDGSLWTWGGNAAGELGNGTTTSRSSPNTVVGAGLNWNRVSVGGITSGGNEAAFGLKNDGTLWSWGNNASAQLGDGTTTARSSPVTTIAGGNNWKQVICAWGQNGFGTREEDEW